MIPELGQFSLILALCLSVLQFGLPFCGILKNHSHWIQTVHPIVLGQAFFITLSILCLAYAFCTNDFSVAFVAQHSNTTLPFMYKISALWGGHEGSLLLWGFIFSIWTVLVSVTGRSLPPVFLARVLIVMGLVSFGFLWFLLATSNPFQRFLPNYPLDGNDLNPLLQDLGLIIHPPLLYMGYVGFAVPFAFAVSALWDQEKEIFWAKWVRPWVLLAFGFLTLGIVLGSWWAYYELGWGGWWFWDPVENASFMPWLVGIALIHSLMVSDKRDIFQGLSLLLAIIAFALSLLGTFLVRSGVLTSVHSFANDPERGIFLLIFLSLVIGGALGLFAFRANRFVKTSSFNLQGNSRELLILIGILFVMVSVATILLGTVFPLIYEVCTGQKLSVGFPYFNAVFIPLMIPVLILVPVGPLSSWGKTSTLELFRKMSWTLILSIILAILIPWGSSHPLSVLGTVGLFLGSWIILGTLKVIWKKIRNKGSIKALSLGAIGMMLAHSGMGICVIGITVVLENQLERDVAIKVGQSVNLSSYNIKFDSVKRIESQNTVGYQGRFLVFDHKKQVATLLPEKQIFVVQGIKMTETAIDPGLFRDLYVSLVDLLPGDKWSVRLYYKPFVRWIWMGGILMALGGFLAALGRRYRL